MKTILNSDYEAPDFDAKITEWLEVYVPSEYDFDDMPRRVGILHYRDGVNTVYRAIDGNGVSQIAKVYAMLESIGLTDLAIYNHPRFNCLYGLPEHRPKLGDPYRVIVWG